MEEDVIYPYRGEEPVGVTILNARKLAEMR